MKAREMMTSHPEVVTPKDPISRAAGIMRDRDIAVRHVADGHTGD